MDEMEEDKKQSVHLWTCDEDGGVHVLFNTQYNGEEDRSQTWRECDGDQRSLACNNGGVVCGITRPSNTIALRTNTTYDNPLGKKWSLSNDLTKVSKLAVGGKHMAMLSATDDCQVMTCPIPTRVITRDHFDPAYLPLPPSPASLHHIVMDTSDTIFGIANAGNIYVYRGITMDTRQGGDWKMLTKPPPIARRGGFLGKLFSRERTLFIDVTVSDGNLFLLRTNPQEIWQLVNKEVDFGNKIEIKCSWNSFKFKPKSPVISLISSNPLNHSELFGVTENNDIVRLDLTGRAITINDNLPYHGLGDIVITSLSSCCVTEDVPTSVATPIYPKLPKLCCEKGDCPECKGKTTIINITEEPNWQDKYKEELLTSVMKWEKGAEYHLPKLITTETSEEKRMKRKRTRVGEAEEGLPTAKKRLSGIHNRDLPRRDFLEGITVVLRNDRLYRHAQVYQTPLEPLPSVGTDLQDFELEEPPSLLVEEQIVNGSRDIISHPVQESLSHTSIMESQSHTSIGMQGSQSHTSILESQSNTSIGMEPSHEESMEESVIEDTRGCTPLNMTPSSVGGAGGGGNELVLKRSPTTEYYTALERIKK